MPHTHATEELVVLLDEHATPIGQHPKATVHTGHTPYHLAFSSYLLDGHGRVLITRRALGKAAWPGVWTNSACGHPAPGEDIASAVRRRTAHELGADIGEPRVVLPEFSYRAVDASGIVEWEFCPVYVARLEVSINPNPDEVCDWAWVEADKLVQAVRLIPEVFSPWMVEQLSDRRLVDAISES